MGGEGGRGRGGLHVGRGRRYDDNDDVVGEGKGGKSRL